VQQVLCFIKIRPGLSSLAHYGVCGARGLLSVGQAQLP